MENSRFLSQAILVPPDFHAPFLALSYFGLQIVHVEFKC